jgi:hypothetical protein
MGIHYTPWHQFHSASDLGFEMLEDLHIRTWKMQDANSTLIGMLGPLRP